MKNFKIHTFGCRTNKYESEVYINQLKALGFKYAQNEEEVAIHIVNTCFVTKNAEKRCILKVKDILSKYPNSKVVVTGCCAAIFDKMDYDNLIIVLNKEKEKLLSYLFSDKGRSSFSLKNIYTQTRAFIKIQDGCNSFCSYCVIPLVRGRSRSRPIEDILEEIKQLVNNGFKEIVLTGINIGDYKDKDKKLSDLVKKIDKINGIKRIRLSSISPDQVDEDLQKVILEGKRTCPSMHLSLQSGSNNILKKMNRNYTKEDFISLVSKLRDKNEDFTFTTDIIIGFPGEREEDFIESLNIVKEVDFLKVHMFPYSKREKTAAATFLDQIPKEIVRKRKEKLLVLAEKKAFDLREKYVGKKMSVLLENKKLNKDESIKYIIGHTENFLAIKVRNESNLQKNEVIDIEIIKNTNQGLIGRFIG